MSPEASSNDAEQGISPIDVEFPTKVGLPSADWGYMMAVRRIDWDRLRNRVGSLSSNAARDIFLGLAFAFIAVAATAGLTLLPLVGENGLNPSVIPALVVVTISSTVASALCFAAFRVVGGTRAASASEIVQEMDAIKAAYPMFEAAALREAAEVAAQTTQVESLEDDSSETRGSPEDVAT
jgi:hypothetical protein